MVSSATELKGELARRRKNRPITLNNSYHSHVGRGFTAGNASTHQGYAVIDEKTTENLFGTINVVGREFSYVPHVVGTNLHSAT